MAGGVWKGHFVSPKPRFVRCMMGSFLLKNSLASQKLKTIPLGSPLRSLALVFPHVTLKHVHICCLP